MRQEQSCLAIAVDEGQTECIFECRANIVANGPHKRANQSKTKRTEGWPNFAKRKQSSDPLFQTANAPGRGRVIKDVNVGESLAERK